jgi:chemotaxis protein methyltransferase CheR
MMTTRPPQALKLGAAEFAQLRQLINEHSGILLADDAIATLERKLSERVLALGMFGFPEYCEHLRYHPQRKAEVDRAIDLVTTNETYFFRELSQLRAFERQVLPNLRDSARSRKRLTVWSAGCSTGEEVYTLAILIERANLFSGWDWRVLGSDISRRVLQTARRGVYREASFRAMPSEYERYFVHTPEGRMVHDSIRAKCHFGHFNLLDEARVAMIGRVDAIFCRNVLIYFDHASRRRVIQSFYDRLEPLGYLMLGHSESLLNTSTAFELAHLQGDLAYRKPIKPDSFRPRRSTP